MSRKKPPLRVKPERSRNNQKRQLCATPPAPDLREAFAAMAAYGCYSKHKYNPSAYGLTPYAGTDEERTYCDAHADFNPADVARIPILLRRGILAGLWAEYSKDTPPRMLWTVDDNGWIYELRITNAGLGQYHGYPVLPSDAFSRKVMEAFMAWASSDGAGELQRDPGIRVAAAAMQDRYR